MHCPQLSELPPPPAGKTGWPWTEETPRVSDGDAHSWPSISVVTPSYNQGQFLEETIRSVLLQGYPDLEYIVIDGGSSDNSVEIIRKYEKWLAYWTSENDRGQSHAINKGWERVTGEISAWLNSDDVYLRHAIQHAANAFSDYPTARMVYGDSILVDNAGTVEGHLHTPAFSLRELLTVNFIPQPSTFLRTAAVAEAGYLDEGLHLCMDYSLWLEVAAKGEARRIDNILSAMRLHPESKTCTQLVKMNVELAEIVDAFLDRQDLPSDLRASRNQLVARQKLVAGSMLWFNDQKPEGSKLIKSCEWQTLPAEEIAIIVAGASVQDASVSPTEQVEEFFDQFANLSASRGLARSWVSILSARRLPSSSLRYARIWETLKFARTRRIARALLPLILSRTFGTRASGMLSGLKRSYDRSLVGLSLSELS